MNLVVSNPRLEVFEGFQSFSSDNDDPELVNLGLRFEAIDPTDLYTRGEKQVIFYNQAPGLIKAWKALLPESRGGDVPDDDENPWNETLIPADLRLFRNCEFYDYDFGGDYIQRYSQDIVNKDGEVIHREGEPVVTRAGDIKITRNKLILVRYKFLVEEELNAEGMPIVDPVTMRSKVKVMRDEHGAPLREWIPGFDPTSVGERIKGLYEKYDPANMNNRPAVSDEDDGEDYDDDDDYEDDGGSQQPARQPQAQRPQHNQRR